MTWHRVPRELWSSDDCPVYISGDRRWTIRKEFYADGPSMFTWVVSYYAEALGRSVRYDEASTLRRAKDLVVQARTDVL
jgi:hypothetical protein